MSDHPSPARQPGSTRLDSYVDRYAARTQGMTASEIRALFSVASRPEVVSLAGGMPNISGLPLDVVGDAIGDLVRNKGNVAMQYGSGQGDPGLREQICDVMRLEGIEAHPDDVVVTVGSQQAVDLVTRIFCDPGDVVICEAPSYVGALGVFKAYQVDVVHVEMDEHGLVPSALRDAITQVSASGRRIKFVYTIPNYHNPAGVTLSAERRPEILEICREADVLVLEDNPYGLLGFDEEPYRALRADEADGVIYLGSFSKTFAPGFRVGWALAPHAVREKLVLAQESATLCPPSFSQLAVSAYLSSHDWLGQVKQFREMYRERRDAMVGALHDMMPAAARWNVPTGGFYVWLTLPPGLDAKAMLPRAVTSRVAYVPGTAFFADGFGSQSMRLSYCYPTPERIREGVRRLVGVIEEELELRETFGAGLGAGVEQRHDPREISRYDGPGTDLT
jgi:2-aminoadipate transaminase